MKRKEETYRLTPLGLLEQDVLDRLLLYFVKNKINALIWTGDGFAFSKVVLKPERKIRGKPKLNSKT